MIDINFSNQFELTTIELIKVLRNLVVQNTKMSVAKELNEIAGLPILIINSFKAVPSKSLALDPKQEVIKDLELGEYIKFKSPMLYDLMMELVLITENQKQLLRLSEKLLTIKNSTPQLQVPINEEEGQIDYFEYNFYLDENLQTYTNKLPSSNNLHAVSISAKVEEVRLHVVGDLGDKSTGNIVWYRIFNMENVEGTVELEVYKPDGDGS